MSREVFHPLGFHLLNLKVGRSHVLILFPALRVAGWAQPRLTGRGKQYESDSPGWCRHSFTPSPNATTGYNPAKPSSGSQHRGELSGTGGYRINFCPDVGIFCREPLLNFYPSRKSLGLTQGSCAMAVKTAKTGKLFSAHGSSAEGQEHGSAGSLSMLCSQHQGWGDSALLFLWGFHTHQDLL